MLLMAALKVVRVNWFRFVNFVIIANYSNMLPQEILKQIRRIQIYTNRKVNDVFAGEYESAFKGQGMQFDEVREYAPGDDIRSIDWNVTARMGKPYIKRFVEEREQVVMLLVDTSGSSDFGTVEKTKNALAAEVCAVLAYSAIKNSDKVGLITFTDKIEKYIPPRKGSQHVLRIIRELLFDNAPGGGTDIAGALEYLARVQKKKSTVFLVSDFAGADITRQLRLVGKRHDLVAVNVMDRYELEMPNIGLIQFQDAETGEIVEVDTSSRKYRDAFAEQAANRAVELERIFKQSKVDQIKIQPGKPYFSELVKFFTSRGKRR